MTGCTRVIVRIIGYNSSRLVVCATYTTALSILRLFELQAWETLSKERFRL